MNLSILVGAGLVLLGGVLQGLFAVPMKFVQRWKYENTWLDFALSGLVVFPWLVTATTVPHLGVVYRLTSTHSIIGITGFGLCWGAEAIRELEFNRICNWLWGIVETLEFAQI